jgi:hypothetical protein
MLTVSFQDGAEEGDLGTFTLEIFLDIYEQFLIHQHYWYATIHHQFLLVVLLRYPIITQGREADGRMSRIALASAYQNK